MADKSQTQNISEKAGEAKAHAQMNKDQMMDKTTGAVNSAKESCQETGQQMKSKAEGATESVKNAMGMNK
ncbi:late embryogenesis abundant protein 2-like [Macadamia integrifolia]|uniref:late embryogenesis abundant protein 2-like n=1 Tax=Macadamia integrifolia TaxID=60698 RepID=UPI001C4FEDF4|nr:late embryogenesis abundant protein 2-like [Macadamia integrifolia]